MPRALWKNPIISSNSISSRNILVTGRLIKKTLDVYNGRRNITVFIESSDFLGKKLGSFAPSKTFIAHKVKKTTNKFRPKSKSKAK